VAPIAAVANPKLSVARIRGSVASTPPSWHVRCTGVEADLQVFEGASHAQYYLNPFTPESKEAFSEIARFFDKHLGQ
jgi:hypothetical protein